MLTALDNLVDRFVCPVTGAPLLARDDGSFSTADGEHSYGSVAGLPVLVDFERSILDRESVYQSSAESSVERRTYGGLSAFVKRLVSPPKRVTRENIALLIELLREQARARSILVVGGGTIGQSMEPIYAESDLAVAAFDIYASPNVQFIADAHQIPIASESFDAVVVQAVLEHVLDPQQVVREIHRVLRPNGLVYSETPFLQQVHEGPYDFTRFTESGHRYLFKDFGLIRSGPSAGPGTQLMWSVEYFVRSVTRSRTAGKLAKLGSFWLRSMDDLVPHAYKTDAASGVFFLGRKDGSNVAPRDIVGYYSGAGS